MVGKRRILKLWDKPRNIRAVKPSRYEQNDPTVKEYWKNVVHTLEMSYKDEQFWETHGEQVREQVGPIVFNRLMKIFEIPLQRQKLYKPMSNMSHVISSEEFYMRESRGEESGFAAFSTTEVESQEELGDINENVEGEDWSIFSSEEEAIPEVNIGETSKTNKTRSRVTIRSGSRILSKSWTDVKSEKSFRDSLHSEGKHESELAQSDDDLEVHYGGVKQDKKEPVSHNPHFHMLYCNKSETDMIKWNSKYKTKAFEVSASDEFTKKAEITTKKIAREFYDWWVSLGNVEFKSEIKRPEDIEDLFQVWFDEQASRGLMMDSRTLPCVLKDIATSIGTVEAACPRVLEEQIAQDIRAEKQTAHAIAFGTCLPQSMKHIPSTNNTEATWHCFKIDEDIRSMGLVFDKIKNITLTKAFHKWLSNHPYCPMPPCLHGLDVPSDKKPVFVVPSDMVVYGKTDSVEEHDLVLPQQYLTVEVKDVLNKLMDS